MKKLTDILVEKRYIFSALIIAVTCICLYYYGQVNVVTDLTTYVSEKSEMKKGMNLMEEEFGELPKNHTIRVMFEGLGDEEKETILSELETIKYVLNVGFVKDSAYYEKDGYTLYVLNVKYDFETPQMNSVIKTLDKEFVKKYNCEYCLDVSGAIIPPRVVVVTVVVLFIILFIMCESFFEPVLFVLNALVGIAINMGSNCLFGSVSITTYTISSILQLVLSMDYTIILAEKYGQAKAHTGDNVSAMKEAMANSITSIAGSAFTTAAGLLALVFMDFRIGLDMGRVLAKGVFVSFICAFTLFPALLMISDRLVTKTKKKRLFIKGKHLAAFAYKGRYVITPLITLVFIGLFMTKSQIGISYFMYAENRVNEVFPQAEQIAIVYRDNSEKTGGILAKELTEYDGIDNCIEFNYTFNRAYTAPELVRFIESFGIEAKKYENVVKLMYYEYYNPGNDMSAMSTAFMGLKEYDDNWTMEPMAVIEFVKAHIIGSEKYAGLIDASTMKMLEDACGMLLGGEDLLKNDGYARIIIDTRMHGGTKEMDGFLDYLYARCEELFGDDYYILGFVPFQRENARGFKSELDKITLITVITVFVIITLIFRNVSIPVILVMIIQTAIYATMAVLYAKGEAIYYLALLMVQCILMGATIDYGILFTTNYKRLRNTMGVYEALVRSYAVSLETILTSGMIMVIVTGAVGIAYDDTTINALCGIVSSGALLAVILSIFVLPGVLCALDKIVIGKREKENGV